MVKIAIIEDVKPIRESYKLLLNQNFADVEFLFNLFMKNNTRIHKTNMNTRIGTIE